MEIPARPLWPIIGYQQTMDCLQSRPLVGGSATGAVGLDLRYLGVLMYHRASEAKING